MCHVLQLILSDAFSGPLVKKLLKKVRKLVRFLRNPSVNKMMKENADESEALGLLRGNELTVLKPHRHAVAYEVKGMLSYEKPVDPREIDEAVTYYQGAAEAFRRGWLKLPVR